MGPHGLMIVIGTGFILVSPLSIIFRQWLCGKAASGLERILCRVLVKKKFRKSWVGALATAI